MAALTLAGALAVGGGITVAAAARTPTTPSVDTTATPAGWVPVDYGDAQLSVPSGWPVEPAGPCQYPDPYAGGLVSLGAQSPQWAGTLCPGIDVAPDPNWVTMEPLVSSALPWRHLSPRVVHGIGVYPVSVSATELVPSLGVELTATGPLATEVLSTLTRSPRAVVLAPGATPNVPTAWHRLSFGGLSMSVPATWPVDRSREWHPGCFSVLVPDTVLLSQGTRTVSSSCPAIGFGGPAQPPVDGVVVDPGPAGPVPPNATTGACLRLHGLRACPITADQNQESSVLTLEVTVPGVPQPVAVAIGVAGNGRTARTILHSLAPASAPHRAGRR